MYVKQTLVVMVMLVGASVVGLAVENAVVSQSGGKFIPEKLMGAGATDRGTTAQIAGTTVTVSQRGRKFTPDTLTVPLGATVRIENDDHVTHHVYIDQPDMKFDSGEQSIGTDVALQFDHEGRFAVRCAIHPTMHLDVVVDHAAAH